MSRQIIETNIDTLLTQATVDDKITASEVRGAVKKSLDYTDEVFLGVDAKVDTGVQSMLAHNFNTNITFTYNSTNKRLEASVPSLPIFDSIPVVNSLNGITSGSVFTELAKKEPTLLPGLAGDVYVGSKEWKPLTTALVPEDGNPTNNRLYFTNGRVLSSVLTNYTIASSVTSLVATDTLVSALGKLEKQITNKQALLVGTETAGQNIKTINGDSILGTGNISISGGSGGDAVRTSVSDLQSVTTASTAQMYYVTDLGKEGFFYYDPTDTISTDPGGGQGGLVIVGTNNKRFKRRITNNEIFLDWFPTSTSDFRPVLKYCTDNEFILVATAGKSYTFTSNHVVTDKNVFIKGNGARFLINTTSDTKFFIEHRQSSNGTVHICSTVGIQNDPTGDDGDIITIPGNIDYINRGDVVRIFAGQNTHPVHNGASGYPSLMWKAEYLNITHRVYNSVANTTDLYFYGSPKYDYNFADATAPVKLVKINKKTIHVENLNIIIQTDSISTGGFFLKGSYMPYFNNVRIERSLSPAFEINTTFGGIIKDCTVVGAELEINPGSKGYGPSSAVGYGINDQSSNNLTVENFQFFGGRHAYTTGGYTDTTSTSTDYYALGEVHGCRIINGLAKNTQAPAWDTHPLGYDIQFINCTAISCPAAFQVRSRAVSIIGGFADRCGTVVYITMSNANVLDGNMAFAFKEPTLISGLQSMNCFNFMTVANTATSGANVVRSIFSPVIMKNCHLHCNTTSTTGIIDLRYCRFEADGCTFDARNVNGSDGDDQWLKSGRGAQVYMNNCKIMWKRSSGYQGAIVNDGDCSLTMIDCEMYGEGSTSCGIVNLDEDTITSCHLRIERMTFTGTSAPRHEHSGSTLYTPLTNYERWTTASVNWKSLQQSKTNRNSCYYKASSTAPSTSYLGYLSDEVIKYVISGLTSAYTLPALPNGNFAGQELHITNNSTFAVTLPAYNAGAARTLLAGRVAKLVYLETGWIYSDIVS